jgi:hypothetical protein
MVSALRAKSGEEGSMLEWSGMAFRRLWCAAIEAWILRHGVITPPP